MIVGSGRIRTLALSWGGAIFLGYVSGVSIAAAADVTTASNGPQQPSGDTAAATPEEGALQEVVVTALHRSAGVQSVPLSIEALSGDTLSKAGASQLDDYYREVPSLNVTAGFNGVVSSDYAYTGRLQSTFQTTDPNYAEYGNFGSFNVRLGVENDKMGAYLFGQNVGNSVGNTAVLTSYGSTRLSYGIQPATYGINVRYKW